MRRIAVLGLAVALSAAVPASAGLVITPTFDSTITSDPNAASIEATINSAIGVYQGMFTNPVTVPIYFQEFTANSGLGQSETVDYFVNYTAYHAGLVATNANPTAIASLNANGGNGPTDPVLGQTQITDKPADLRAVGLAAFVPACHVTPGDTTPATNSPNHCTTSGGIAVVDGIITLNTQITSPPNPLSGNFSLLSTVEHEIDEVLGLGSALPNTSASSGTVTANNVLPEDLWRYAPGGGRVFTVNCAGPGGAVFSVDGSGNGRAFNNQCNGGDFGDWQGAGPAQVQDAFASSGVSPTLGANEISALTAIGYQLTASVPEPGTIGLLLSSLAVVALLRRRI